MPLSATLQQLRPLELVATAPLEPLDPTIVQATLREQADSVVLTLACAAGQHCPIEMIFGRGQFANQLSIFLGRGAEFCNAEPITTRDEALELAEDLRDLASSVILSDEQAGRGGRLKVTYTVQFSDRSPLQLTYQGPQDIDGSIGRRSVVYTPWL